MTATRNAFDGAARSRWRERLDRGEVLLLDGGTGSELRRRGFPMRDDVWSAAASVTHFDLLRAVHEDYVRAGADAIIANTFAGTRFVLAAGGLGGRFEEINRRAVAAAMEARAGAGRAVAVAGSLSCLPPRFDPARYPAPAAEARAYRELAELLAACGVDAIALEMLEETRHAPLACEAARATGLPFWLGVSCRLDRGRLVAFDFPDVTLDQCLDALLPYAPAVVNVMHTPPDAVLPALELIRARWRGPLGVYPELGSAPGPAGGGPALPPAGFAAAARAWVAAGARLVGGCCGTTPEHIAALRDLRR
ncbi:MAG TPA: homocysteine S-methyltransferase family protein [Gammaproteobacteria bacterium]